MKKTIAILSAFVALVACNKTVVPEQENPVPEDKQELKINFTVTRADINDTKATVKTGWAENDVVFVFFNGVAAPKYLEMKYDGTTWNTELKGMTADDLAAGAAAADRRMTAVYLPYGSAYTVGADGTAFTIKNGEENYSGHFYIDEQKKYTFVSSILSGKIELSAAQPASGSDKLVHFDVSQYTDGHTYAMYQENMKPISLSSIAADGEVATAEGTVGDALPGYIDAENSIVSFSGVLESATGAKNWWFSIRDTEDGTLYYRDGGSKTVESNMYIGLGKLTAWNVATPGDFTVSAGGDKITIARSNLSYLGATGGSHPWQLMKYPWTVIETNAVSPFIPSSSVDFGLFGWATSGYNGNNPWNYGSDATVFGPSLSDSASAEDRTAWYNKYANKEWYIVEPETTNWDWAKYNTIYQYGGATSVGDGWRTPTRNEFDYILFTRTDDYRCVRATVGGRPGIILFPDGFVLPLGITVNHLNPTNGQLEATYAENTYTNLQWNILEVKGSVFFPAGGYRGGSNNNIVNFNTYGGYSTSTIGDRKYRYVFTFDHQGIYNATFVVQGVLRTYGMSVRLVRDLVNVGNYDTWNDNDI